MIDDDIITRVAQLHDHIKAPDTVQRQDVLRGQRRLRRRRAMVAGVAATAGVMLLGLVPAVTVDRQSQDELIPGRSAPSVAPTDQSSSRSPSVAPTAGSPGGKATLQRIRSSGRVERERVMGSGITVRTHVLCDGSPECSPETDGPIRHSHEQRAIEVTQGGRSWLFQIGSPMTAVAAYDGTTLLIMDPLPAARDHLDIRENGFRLVRADGTEISLRLVPDPAPPVAGPGVVLISPYDLNPDNDSVYWQFVFVVDEGERTVRPLAMPPNLDSRRTWGPNLHEYLWFVTFDCRVYFWPPGGSVQTREAPCSDSFDPGHDDTSASGDVTDRFGNPGSGDFTWVNAVWFPDGWLAPGRMALLERDFVGRGDSRLTLHVTFDGAVTWQQVPVRDEAAIPDALERLG